MPRPRILSGMRPTGDLHIGHLVGALENWVALQDDYECFYMVADWHAVMSEFKDTKSLRKHSISNVADWIACGVDPKRSTLFIQSSIPEHVELWAAFSMVTPVSWLERCPTYKEQMQELSHKDLSSVAFLGYPALQTADIALYKGEIVPVGKDQEPHLEVAREIIRRFNGIFGNIFPEPKVKLTETPKLNGTDNRKMSKSYGNAIELSAKPEQIRAIMKTMVTDPKRARRTDPGTPEQCNVYSWYQAFAKDLVALAADECRGAKIGCIDCKMRLADRMIPRLAPIAEKRAALMADDARAVRAALAEGEEKARAVAQATMKEVKGAIFPV